MTSEVEAGVPGVAPLEAGPYPADVPSAGDCEFESCEFEVEEAP